MKFKHELEFSQWKAYPRSQLQASKKSKIQFQITIFTFWTSQIANLYSQKAGKNEKLKKLVVLVNVQIYRDVWIHNFTSVGTKYSKAPIYTFSSHSKFFICTIKHNDDNPFPWNDVYVM